MNGIPLITAILLALAGWGGWNLLLGIGVSDHARTVAQNIGEVVEFNDDWLNLGCDSGEDGYTATIVASGENTEYTLCCKGRVFGEPLCKVLQ